MNRLVLFIIFTIIFGENYNIDSLQIIVKNHIVNIILGENLSKGVDPSFIELLYNDNYLTINSNGKIGGIQLEYRGSIEIKAILPTNRLGNFL